MCLGFSLLDVVLKGLAKGYFMRFHVISDLNVLEF